MKFRQNTNGRRSVYHFRLKIPILKGKRLVVMGLLVVLGLIVLSIGSASAAITDNYQAHIIHWLNGTDSGVQTSYLYYMWIYNVSGTNTTDTVFLNGAFKTTDLHDLFITDSNGNNVSYWNETANASAVKVWWNQSTTPSGATGQDFINISIGWSDAPYPSNIFTTGLPGSDDFNAGALNTSIWNTAGTPTVSNGVVTVTGTGSAVRIYGKTGSCLFFGVCSPPLF